jgi:hypothetical protein
MYLTRRLEDGIMERKGAVIAKQRDSQHVSVVTDTAATIKDGVFSMIPLLGNGAVKSPVQ